MPLRIDRPVRNAEIDAKSDPGLALMQQARGY